MNGRLVLFSVFLLGFIGLFTVDGNNSADASAIASVMDASDSDSSLIPGSTAGALPSDPNDWICQDSVVDLTPAQIVSWCRANADRGEPAPSYLRVPPPLADLQLKIAMVTKFSWIWASSLGF